MFKPKVSIFAKLIEGNGYETWQISLLYVFVLFLDRAFTVHKTQ